MASATSPRAADAEYPTTLDTDACALHQAYPAASLDAGLGFVKVARPVGTRRSFDSAYERDTPLAWGTPVGKGLGFGSAARPPLAPSLALRGHELLHPLRAQTMELPQSAASHIVSKSLIGPLSRRYSAPVSPFEVVAASRSLHADSTGSVQAA